MTVEELEAAILRISPGGRKCAQIPLIARIAFYGGLRAGEIFVLQPDDVSCRTDSLSLSVPGKGSEHRFAYLPRSMAPQFEGFSGFDISYESVVKIIGAVGITGLHSLRYSCAARMISLGVNLRDLQILLGYSNLEMIERYPDFSCMSLPAEMKAMGY